MPIYLPDPLWKSMHQADYEEIIEQQQAKCEISSYELEKELERNKNATKNKKVV